MAGSGRSGSTLVEWELWKRIPKAIAVGEAYQVAKAIFESNWELLDSQCGCGESSDNCGIWNEIIADWKDKRGDKESVSVKEIYFEILSAISEKLPDFWIIDSSKYAEPLSWLVEKGSEVELRAIHLVRDVRGVTESHRGRIFSGNARSMPFWRRWLVSRRSYVFLGWWKLNKKIEAVLKGSEIFSFPLSYEMLCMTGDQAWGNIEKAIDCVEFEAVEGKEIDSYHSLFSNRMRNDPQKKNAIVYDPRWMQATGVGLTSLILPFVMADNDRWVYEGWQK